MLNFIFPINCVGCERQADQSYICSECYTKLCDKFSYKFTKDYCHDLDGLIYLSDLSPVLRKLITMGKYKFSKAVWKRLGTELSKRLILEAGVVTYTPIDWIRFCYRGFNQSKILARTVSSRSNLKLVTVVSKRFRIGHLAHLNKTDRAKTIRNSFKICESVDLNSYKRCYIVDDIYTTGATLNEVASTIKNQYPHLIVIGIVIGKTKKKY